MTVQGHHRHRHPRAVSQPAADPATPMYLEGIDVSHWDGVVNWSEVKSAGVTFAFAKATEGVKSIDHTFSVNWAGMKAIGLVRGAYHFGRPKQDAAAQAKHFFNVAQPTHGDLQLSLDLEVNDGLKPAAVWTWAKDFLAEIEALSGRPAIFYSYGPFWIQDMGNPKENQNCPLWLADYRHTAHVPSAWTDWTFWQYTDKGTVAGIKSHVDRNYFRGTLADLQQLTFP